MSTAYAILYGVAFSFALSEILVDNYRKWVEVYRTGLPNDRQGALLMNILAGIASIATMYVAYGIADGRVDVSHALLALFVGFFGFFIRHMMDTFNMIFLREPGTPVPAWSTSLVQRYITIFAAIAMGVHAYTNAPV